MTQNCMPATVGLKRLYLDRSMLDQRPGIRDPF